ncbi:heterokaryon incompatibility protein-domain-containing protein [Fusarium redolens]|uniref:Heterokaryon incompatibility protein-domain-containing protein n=1 Tax=Fusarium redolens TaxID=48865 RepID=A0A9P9K4T5_FUSRE|nr:heterokaryon incompatibility protein-domain-containing protein [Fusarium redolens]KAH7240194.1 heterokaryon incompatibility protein-domain-containing protein [Fusarium redolens]
MPEPKMHIYMPLQHGEVRMLRCRRTFTSTGAVRCSTSISGPGSTRTTIAREIGIDRVRLTDSPSFTALSYTWGSPNQDHQLRLCDNTLLPITKSLAEALIHVLDDIEDGFLWIDQICINQNNNNERNHQVPMMGDIYRRARRVFVWLGTEATGAERIDRIFQDFETATATLTTDMMLMDAFVLSQEAYLNKQAMISMMKLPWFERAWVVQEFVLAQDPIFAHGRFRWHPDTMFLVTCLFRDLGRETFSKFLRHEISYLRKNHPFQIMQNTKEVHEDFHLLLSRMGSKCKASEPRDRVYAFLALNRDPRINIKAMYDVPVHRVFTEVARTIITATENLDILAVAPRQPPSISHIPIEFPEDYPSWAPNWCCDRLSVPLYSRASHVPFNACLGLPWIEQNPQPDEPNHLILQGRVIATVYETSPILSGTGSRQRVLRVCISDGSFIPHLSARAVARDLEFRQSIGLSHANLESLLYVLNSEEQPESYIDEKLLLEEYVLVLQNRKLFVTADGRIGLAQSCVRAGDTVIIAHGSATPLVIRTIDERKQAFKLIGQCYLENAMFGEECDFEKWPMSSFCIT